MNEFLKDTLEEIKLMFTWFSDKCRNTKYGIENLVVWFPVIWKDRNWDHTFIFEIFRKKLLEQSKHIKKYGHHVNKDRDARNMMISVYCLNRLLDDDIYHDMAFKNHYKKWGKPDFRWEDLPDRELVQLHIDYPNVFNKEDDKKERKDFRRCSDHEAMLQNQDLNYFTMMFNKHVFGWWD